jgi:hypothetical protein
VPDVRARHVTPRLGPAAAASLVLLLVAGGARADVFVLRGGDRITGKPLLEGKRTFKVQTPYGTLTIPRSKVDRILRPDGREELVTPERSAEPSSEPSSASSPERASRRARLILIITGKTFWHAWEPKDGSNPTLRLEVRLDEEVVATYVDAKTDPEIPGAVVNSFSFAPEDLSRVSGEDARVLAPEPRPGRIALKIDVAPSDAPQRLRVSYQVGEGPPEEKAWRDLAVGSVDIALRPEAPTFVRVNQDRGRMEFSGFPRRRMKYVETFKLDLSPETASSSPLTP